METQQLNDLRAELVRQGLHGFLVPRADEHLGESVPACAERLAWLTGFTGSAGVAIVLPERACLFVDGRYVLQAAAQTDPVAWERRHVIDEPPHVWLAATIPAGAPIGYDAMLVPEDALARYSEAGCTMVPVAQNPIDSVWADRPAPPLHPAAIHPLELAGRSSTDKRAEVAAALRAASQHAAVLTDPASIAWLLNIRGSDIPFTPVALGFGIVHDDATVELFMNPVKLPVPLMTWLGNEVSVQDRTAMPAALGALAGRTVRVDGAASPAWFAQTARAAGGRVVDGPDPCLLLKACKNPAEQAGSRSAHRRDAVAVCRFLHWFSVLGRSSDELQAAARLRAFREGQEDFRDDSFSTISAAGEHGAIIHYRADADSNRLIRADELYLIDSGAQYGSGTTDITRTVWSGPGEPEAELRDRYTRVLKGHIAIATLLFPRGASGAHLDAFARHALWQAGLDFDHGTGHGVGSYLSVHEGPVSLSRLARPVPLDAGMILSNEPGFYAPGRYGIRLENLVLVQAAEIMSDRPFLRFETLTFAPFDRRMIDEAMLSPAERIWLDAYHRDVGALVGPSLPRDARDWLDRECLPLAAAS